GRQRRRAFKVTKSWSKAMTSKWKYRISVRAVILSLPYFVFPFVKPGDRLKVGGPGVWVFRYRTTFLWKSFTTFCSSFSAGVDKRSTTSVSTAKRLADDATCE